VVVSIALDIGPHLRTRKMARIVEVHATIGSTNDRARLLAREGAAHGTVVVSHAQTKGRGQRGRKWFSPPFAGLYASFIVRPKLAPKRAQALAIITGVALHDAVRSVAAIETKIRWPNDLVSSEGRKLAGVLVEASADPVRVDHAVIGIGLNLKDVAFPGALAAYATSLEALTRRAIAPGEILAAVAFELERRLDAGEHKPFEAIEDWSKHAAGRGEEVSLRVDDESITGTLKGVAEDGALILVTGSGDERWFHRGELLLPSAPLRPTEEFEG
jgi:BirA family biotin operon repressor/biotin-[acetyl-CoA-carboxylase] ligase